MNPPTIERLLGIILTSFKDKAEIFDIPEKLFYKHWHNHVLYTRKFGQELHNPIGLAAGPHTQTAQGIISGWLCGARFIELKTVQPQVAEKIIRPSIDLQNVAFNCENALELSIEQAYDQFLNAWIIIHLLDHMLSNNPHKSKGIGTIFNMSLGYTLADIRSERMEWFVDKMMDCSVEKDVKINKLKKLYPEIKNIDIPNQISNNFTISTYRGASAREMEYICKFLMVDKKLHPTVKFDPTLMGYKSVEAILSAEDSFEVELNAEDFDDNVQYAESITLIENISKTAEEMKLELMVKLSNSLACKNTAPQLSSQTPSVYLSGTALHPIAVNLAAKLQSKFDGRLDVSFSGGADCFNVASLIQSGFSLITVCTDLLKPGGYGRLNQYFQELMKVFANYQAKNIGEFILKSGTEYGVKESALASLRNYAIRTLNDPSYKISELSRLNIKSDRKLGSYDCIQAPCTQACATHPVVAAYCYFTTKNDADKAINAILADNPLPMVSGMIANTVSRLICTRMNYDYPVLMPDIERFIAEFEPGETTGLHGLERNMLDVAVIGAGASGLACAWFLSKYGFNVDIYEADKHAGGLMRKAVPEFRLQDSALFKDIQRIKSAGVKILNSTEIDKERFARILKTYTYVYVASGSNIAEKMNIEGEDAEGVFDPVDFLAASKLNPDLAPGKNIVVIGNNWMAADAVRAAKRMLKDEGTATLICDGSIDDMAIDIDSRAALLEEGIEIFEYSRPKRIITDEGKVAGLELIETEVFDQIDSNETVIKEIEGSEQIFKFDVVIPCMGRKSSLSFMDIKKLKVKKGFTLARHKNVFAGGSLMHPSSTSVAAAIAGAKQAAKEIAFDAGIQVPEDLFKQEKNIDIDKLKLQKVHREKPNKPEKLSPEARGNFDMVVKTLKPVKAIKEAARCLQCDTLCDVCVAVCPNRAMLSFEVSPENLSLPLVTFFDDQFKVEYQDFGIKQKYQVLNIADWCNDCGNCTTFCPTSGSPNKDKIRVYFSRNSFNNDSEGVLLERSENRYTLTMKKGARLATLTIDSDDLVFENDDCLAVLEKDTFAIIQIDNFSDKDVVEVPEIQEMKMIYSLMKDYV